MNNHLYYLVAAYSSVWIIVSFYLFILIRKNRSLSDQLAEMEKRILSLEKTDTKSD